MNPLLADLYSEYADPDEDLPTELLLNPDHPSNEQFYQDLAHIKRAVIAAQHQIRPMQRHALMLYRNGMKYSEIASKLESTGSTISKWINDPKVQRLNTVMDHHRQLEDGPTFEHRKNILYRIALEQMKSQPKTTITAIQEINKMSGVYQQDQGGMHAGGDINIQINGELLPRGALDVLPNTYETRQDALLIDGSS